MARSPVTLRYHPDGWAELIFCEPEFTPALCDAMLPHVEALSQTGAGRDAVCAVVIRAWRDESAAWPLPPDAPAPGYVARASVLVEAVAALPMPVLALLAGEIRAEALELALACDLRLAADDTRFSMPYLAQGRLPACGGSQRLPRVVGLSAAFELFFTGDWDAGRAHELGLINGVAAPGDLGAEGEQWCRALAGKAPVAARFLKEVVRRGLDVPLEQGLLIEEDAYLLLQTTEDRKEGIRAFLEKRQPRFKGK